jgi:hypothetical protein
MAREENKSVGPKKETGLRHPLGDPNKETNLRHPIGEPVIRENRRKADKEKIETKTSNSIKPKKVIKKVLGLLKNLTPGGATASAIKIVRENAKRAERKLNNEKLNPGKTPKPMKTGGRAGYKDGSVCKMTTKGRGNAYGKNS